MDKNKILIANTGEDSLTIIDLANDYKAKTIFLSDLIQKHEGLKVEGSKQLRPLNLGLSEDGYVLVANSYDNSVMKIDIINGHILGVLKVGKNPTAMESFQGKTYVVNTDSNSVSVIDNGTFTLIEDIPVGEKPNDIKICKISCKCYVANWGCCTLNVLDLKDDKIESISLEKQPIKILLEKDKLFILSYINNGVMNLSNLTELSIVDYEIKMSIDLKGIFDDFTKVEDEEVFYLSSADDGYLYKVFLNNGVNISKIYLGGMPSTLKWAGRTQLYITNILKGEINILDTLSNQIVKNLRVGKEPCGILLL